MPHLVKKWLSMNKRPKLEQMRLPRYKMPKEQLKLKLLQNLKKLKNLRTQRRKLITKLLKNSRLNSQNMYLRVLLCQKMVNW